VSRNPHAIPHAHLEPVGVFESQKYLNLEATRVCPEDAQYSAKATALLNECCGDLIIQNKKGIDGVVEWLGAVREGRWSLSTKEIRKVGDKRGKNIEEVKAHLEASLDAFRKDKRYLFINCS
jgi:hypothetical protein